MFAYAKSVWQSHFEIRGDDEMHKTLVAGIVGLGVLGGCSGPMTATSVQEMPTGYLCTFLDPNTWTTTGSERSVIFAELKKRDADCILPGGTSKPNF